MKQTNEKQKKKVRLLTFKVYELQTAFIKPETEVISRLDLWVITYFLLATAVSINVQKHKLVCLVWHVKQAFSQLVTFDYQFKTLTEETI